jgi:hypothetical protein
VSKTVYPDSDSTATTTSTSSTCYTVTACTGSQSSFTTTTQTTTTVENLCARESACGNACGPVKRNMGVIPTAVPQLDDSGSLGIGSTSFNSTLTKRALSKREIPMDGTGDWADYYETIEKDSSNTYKIDSFAQTDGTLASWVRYKWGNSPQNVLVEGLFGCKYTCSIRLRWLLIISLDHRCCCHRGITAG